VELKKTIMPFGKYRGEDLGSIPTSYLQWFAENIEGNDLLVKEVENQLTSREGVGINRGKAKHD